jgi:hypothetical protein
MHPAAATGRKQRRKSLTAKAAAKVDRSRPEFPIWTEGSRIVRFRSPSTQRICAGAPSLRFLQGWGF